jgi:hypothetical protein
VNPAPRTRSGGQSLLAPSQSSAARRTGRRRDGRAGALQIGGQAGPVPGQVSMASTWPAAGRQTKVDGWNASEGGTARWSPLRDSTMSHGWRPRGAWCRPGSPRQGHAALAPLRLHDVARRRRRAAAHGARRRARWGTVTLVPDVSATSQAPAEGRHDVPAGWDEIDGTLGARAIAELRLVADVRGGPLRCPRGLRVGGAGVAAPRCEKGTRRHTGRPTAGRQTSALHVGGHAARSIADLGDVADARARRAAHAAEGEGVSAGQVALPLRVSRTVTRPVAGRRVDAARSGVGRAAVIWRLCCRRRRSRPRR